MDGVTALRDLVARIDSLRGTHLIAEASRKTPRDEVISSCNVYKLFLKRKKKSFFRVACPPFMYVGVTLGCLRVAVLTFSCLKWNSRGAGVTGERKKKVAEANERATRKPENLDPTRTSLALILGVETCAGREKRAGLSL